MQLNYTLSPRFSPGCSIWLIQPWPRQIRPTHSPGRACNSGSVCVFTCFPIKGFWFWKLHSDKASLNPRKVERDYPAHTTRRCTHSGARRSTTPTRIHRRRSRRVFRQWRRRTPWLNRAWRRPAASGQRRFPPAAGTCLLTPPALRKHGTPRQQQGHASSHHPNCGNTTHPVSSRDMSPHTSHTAETRPVPTAAGTCLLTPPELRKHGTPRQQQGHGFLHHPNCGNTAHPVSSRDMSPHTTRTAETRHTPSAAETCLLTPPTLRKHDPPHQQQGHASSHHPYCGNTAHPVSSRDMDSHTNRTAETLNTPSAAGTCLLTPPTLRKHGTPRRQQGHASSHHPHYGNTTHPVSSRDMALHTTHTAETRHTPSAAETCLLTPPTLRKHNTRLVFKQNIFVRRQSVRLFKKVRLWNDPYCFATANELYHIAIAK